MAAVLCLGLSAAGGLPGCGGSGPGPERKDARSLSTPNRPLWQEPKGTEAGAAATAPRIDDGRDALSAYAADLQSLFDQMKAEPPEEPLSEPVRPAIPPPITAASPPPDRPVLLPETPPVAQGPAPVLLAPPEQVVETPPAAPPIELTPEERRAELLAQLTSLLGRAAGNPDAIAASAPLTRAVRLAALEAIEPGIATAELDRLEAQLLPTEAAVLRPLRELFGRLGASASGQADPAAIAGLMDEYSKRLAQARPLTLPTAALCERVESFGRYTPFRAATFAAGREHSAILYVEVENFAQRTAPGDGRSIGGSEQWITELGQSLDLHHDADGSLQWRQAEQVVRESSRRRRSDYYLVQRITLPSTLSVGRYNLKVTVNDKISGATAQARIPIQIVADPSLAKSP